MHCTPQKKGMTGSGKSSFIADSTGRSNVVVGHDLASCTNHVEIFKARMGGRAVYLLDTPGFDDTSRSDMEVLATIAHYFSVSYARGVALNGVLYLHRISDTRMGGAARRNLDMLKGLVGRASFGNVALLTTMWRADDDAEAGRQRAREAQLRAEYFADMVAGEAVMLRHGPYYAAGADHDASAARRAGARAILEELMQRWADDAVTLQIQYEMVDEQARLDQTTAGRTLLAQVEAAQATSERKMADNVEYLFSLRSPSSTTASTGGGGGAHNSKRSNKSDNNDPDPDPDHPPDHQPDHDHDKKETLKEQSDLRRQLEASRAAQADMQADIFELHRRERARLLGQLARMEAGWEAALADKARQEEAHEARFREMQRLWAEERQRIEDTKLQLGAAEGGGQQQEQQQQQVYGNQQQVYEQQQQQQQQQQQHQHQQAAAAAAPDPRVEQLLAQQRHLEALESAHREELLKMQAEVARMRQQTGAKMAQTRRAKFNWGSSEDWLNMSYAAVNLTTSIVVGGEWCSLVRCLFETCRKRLHVLTRV
jgi:hypothetical protein